MYGVLWLFVEKKLTSELLREDNKRGIYTMVYPVAGNNGYTRPAEDDEEIRRRQQQQAARAARASEPFEKKEDTPKVDDFKRAEETSATQNPITQPYTQNNKESGIAGPDHKEKIKEENKDIQARIDDNKKIDMGSSVANLGEKGEQNEEENKQDENADKSKLEMKFGTASHNSERDNLEEVELSRNNIFENTKIANADEINEKFSEYENTNHENNPNIFEEVPNNNQEMGVDNLNLDENNQLSNNLQEKGLLDSNINVDQLQENGLQEKGLENNNLQEEGTNRNYNYTINNNYESNYNQELKETVNNFSNSDKELFESLGYNPVNDTFNTDFSTLSKSELRRLGDIAQSLPTDNNLRKALNSEVSKAFTAQAEKEKRSSGTKKPSNNLSNNASTNKAAKEDRTAKKEEVPTQIKSALKSSSEFTSGEIATISQLSYNSNSETFDKNLPLNRDSLSNLRSIKDKLDRDKTPRKVLDRIDDEIARVEHNKTPEEWQKLKEKHKNIQNVSQMLAAEQMSKMDANTKEEYEKKGLSKNLVDSLKDKLSDGEIDALKNLGYRPETENFAKELKMKDVKAAQSILDNKKFQTNSKTARALQQAIENAQAKAVENTQNNQNIFVVDSRLKFLFNNLR